MVFLPSNLGFLFLSRCLIFKVQSLPFFRQLKEYTTSISLCQDFFQTFFKFFQASFFRPLRVPPRECLHILSPLLSFVNSFLQTFLSVFTNQLPFCTLNRVCLCPLPFLPLYLAVRCSFVKFSLYVGELSATEFIPNHKTVKTLQLFCRKVFLYYISFIARRVALLFLKEK